MKRSNNRSEQVRVPACKDRGQTGQRGMASIVITMITMVVITLIVLGFATISRREQRQSLDQLLSTQAFYAAESAVEDASSIIKQRLANSQPVPAKTNCTTDPSGVYPVSGGANDPTVVDAEYNVSYTCLTVDPAPTSVQFDGVGDNAVVVPLTTNNPINNLEIRWRPASPPASGTPSADCPAAATGSFAPQSGGNAWRCGYGVLRAEITLTDGALTSAGLANNTLHGIFVPLRNGTSGQLAYNTNTNRPNIVGADCVTTSYTECTARITNINTGPRSMSLRLSAMYQPSRISVQAFNGSNAQGISGVQAVIDATGKASDVLRRIQVRMPLINTRTAFPGNAISSNGAICKRFGTTASSFRIPGDIVDRDTQNAMCNPLSDGNVPQPPSACVVDNDIAMVLDRSGSMSAVWQNASSTAMGRLKEVSRRFVETTDIAAGSNNAAIVSFATNATIGVPLTGNPGPLLAYIDSLNPDGDTYYLTGLTAAQNVLNNARGGSQRVVVFVSDGAPENGSDGPSSPAESLSDIRARTTAMKAAGIVIYTVGIDGRSYAQPDDPFNEQLLRDMSSGPGYYSNANSEAELGTVLENISRDLRCLP